MISYDRPIEATKKPSDDTPKAFARLMRYKEEEAKKRKEKKEQKETQTDKVSVSVT